jgi:hypothetical protein
MTGTQAAVGLFSEATPTTHVSIVSIMDNRHVIDRTWLLAIGQRVGI